jgi:hypothetical protein
MPDVGEKGSEEDISQSRMATHREDRIHTNASESANIVGLHKEDWRQPLIRYLQKPDYATNRRIRRQALKYTVIDDELYRRTMDGLLLKCLNDDQVRFGNGQGTGRAVLCSSICQQMKWTLKRVGLYWPSRVSDCIKYKRGCEAFLKFGDLHLVPTGVLQPIIKPWSFRGCTTKKQL